MKYVCSNCIIDEYLSSQIKRKGTKSKCSYCKKPRRAFPLDEIAGQLHQVIQDYYEITSEEPEGYDYYLQKQGKWERPGDDVSYIIYEIMGVEGKIAEDLQEILNEEYPGDYKSMEEGPYSDTTLYVEKHNITNIWLDEWGFFLDNLKSNSRFFGHQKFLEKVFKNIHSFVTHNAESVVKIYEADQEKNSIFRARIASKTEFEKILKSPEIELGPPPYEKRKPGRMNPYGLSVFYGATDEKTAITEIRPYISASIVIAKFEIIKKLKLLDFRALKSIQLNGSLLDPKYRADLSLSKFLSILSDSISRPVMPDDEPFDYLPTQIIADYLSWDRNLGFDGLIYPSSLVPNGSNIVLLKQASLVDQSNNLDPANVSVWTSSNPEDEEDEVYVLATSEEEELKKEPIRAQPWLDTLGGLRKKEDAIPPAIKLIRSSLKVMRIRGLELSYTEQRVRSLQTQSDDFSDDF